MNDAPPVVRAREQSEAALLLFRVGLEEIHVKGPRTDAYWRLLLATWLLYACRDTYAAFSDVEKHLHNYKEERHET